MSAIEVLESPLGRVEIDRDAHFVRLVRSNHPVDLPTLEGVVSALTLAVPLRERPRLALLQDMRLGPLIRDDATEAALAAAVPRLTARFAARAVLVASAVGVLQAGRFVRAVGGQSRTFTDEGEALAYLATEISKLRSR